MLITQSLSYDYHKGSMEQHRNAIVEELKKSLIPSVVRVLPGLIGYQSQAIDGHIQVCASVAVLPGQEAECLHERSVKLDKLLKHMRSEYDTAVACIEQLPDMSADERQRQENLKTHYADMALLAGVDFRKEDHERKLAREKHKSKLKRKRSEEEDEVDYDDDGVFDAFGDKPAVEEEDECEDEAWDEPTPAKKRPSPLTLQADPLAEFHEEEDKEDDTRTNHD